MSFLSDLVHYANANPSDRSAFYAIKDRLLRRYGKPDGVDVQELTTRCWGWRDDYGDVIGCDGRLCTKCGGTGIFSCRYVHLERYRLGKYVFHIPGKTTYYKPDAVHIKGLVKHADYGEWTEEAELWLYAMFDWRALWRNLTSRYRGQWSIMPFLALQYVLWKSRSWWKNTFGKCSGCNKWFLRNRKGSDYFKCRRCASDKIENPEIPF